MNYARTRERGQWMIYVWKVINSIPFLSEISKIVYFLMSWYVHKNEVSQDHIKLCWKLSNVDRGMRFELSLMSSLKKTKCYLLYLWNSMLHFLIESLFIMNDECFLWHQVPLYLDMNVSTISCNCFSKSPSFISSIR